MRKTGKEQTAPQQVSNKTIRAVFDEALSSKKASLAYLKRIGVTFGQDGSAHVRPL